MEFTSPSQKLSKLSTLREISPEIAFQNRIFSDKQNQLPRIKAIPIIQQTTQINFKITYQQGISYLLSSTRLNKNETEKNILINDESLTEQVGLESFIANDDHSKSMISTKANSEQQSTSNLSINDSFETEDITQENHQEKINFNILDSNSANLNILGDQTKVAQEQLSIEDFEILSLCGQGSFGAVYIVKHRITGYVYALKKIRKEKITSEIDKEFLIREIKIHLKLNHSNIIKFYTTFSSSEAIYFLMELCPSGNLYEKLREEGSFSESYVKSIIRQLCKAIDYLHSLDIIHGDVKAENIVLQGNVAKLCDFGWATEGNFSHKQLFGTLIYMSPEIIKNQSYDNKVDVWSMGVLTYELIYGKIPFQVRSHEDLSVIVCEDVYFPRQKEVSKDCKDFMNRCLQKNSSQRWDTQRLLDHPFLKRE